MIEFVKHGSLRLYWRLFKLRMTSMYFGLSPACLLPAALICLLACVLGLSAVKTNMCFIYSSALLQSASSSNYPDLYMKHIQPGQYPWFQGQ